MASTTLNKFGLLVVTFVLCGSSTATAESASSELMQLLDATTISERRIAEARIVSVINQSTDSEYRYSLLLALLEDISNPEPAWRSSAARILSKLAVPWNVDGIEQWKLAIYEEMRAEQDEVIRGELERALMNAHGLYRSALAVRIVDESSAKQAVSYYDDVIAFSESEYAVRASILAARALEGLWFRNRTTDSSSLLAAISRYEELIESDLFGKSPGGWRYRNDAIFFKSLAEVAAGQVDDALLGMMQLENWQPELIRAHEMQDTPLEYISHLEVDYIDPIFIYQFYPGDFEIVSEYYDTRAVAYHVANFLDDLSNSDGTQEGMTWSAKYLDEFVGYLHEYENPIYIISFGTFHSRADATESLYDLGIQIESIIDEIKTVAPQFRLYISQPWRGSDWGVTAYPALTESELESVRNILSEVQVEPIGLLNPTVF